MKFEDVKIGMKVVPFQKTVKGWGNNLSESVNWEEAIKKNQKFLYINRIDEDKEIVLGHIKDAGGDFFYAEDFEPYEELEIFKLDKHWNEFINDKIAVNCKTKELAKEFLEYCHSNGIARQENTYWESYKEKTCYNIEDNHRYFANANYYKNNNYKIVEFKGINNKPKTENIETITDIINRYACDITNNYPFEINKKLEQFFDEIISKIEE